jgi:sec-independent protein translocase protein TatC
VNLENSKSDLSCSSFIEHLEEFRRRLILSLLMFFVSFMLCFMIKEYLLNFLLLPYKWAMTLSGGDPDLIRLQSTQVLETFVTKVKISAFGGVILSFPFVAFEAYCFIAPGLYRKERMAFVPFLIAAPLLFLIGAAFVYYLVAPLVFWFGLSQQLTLDTRLHIDFIAKISEYLSFMTSLILAFGFVFQLPVVTTLLIRIKLLNYTTLVAMRKWACIAAFILAAMVTPSDLLSMLALALPTVLLYEISIFLARAVEKKHR